MTTRYEAWMNGVALSSLADEIIIDDIQEQQPKTNVESYTVAIWNGTRVMHSARPSLSVTVRFMVRAYDPARRQTMSMILLHGQKAASSWRYRAEQGCSLIASFPLCLM